MKCKNIERNKHESSTEVKDITAGIVESCVESKQLNDDGQEIRDQVSKINDQSKNDNLSFDMELDLQIRQANALLKGKEKRRDSNKVEGDQFGRCDTNSEKSSFNSDNDSNDQINSKSSMEKIEENVLNSKRKEENKKFKTVVEGKSISATERKSKKSVIDSQEEEQSLEFVADDADFKEGNASRSEINAKGILLKDSHSCDSKTATKSDNKLAIKRKRRLIESDSDSASISSESGDISLDEVDADPSLTSSENGNGDEVAVCNAESNKTKKVKKSSKKRARIIEDSSSDSNNSAADDDVICLTKNNKIPKRSKKASETVDAEKAEKERRKRLEFKQQEFNCIELLDESDLSIALGSECAQRVKSVILDPDKDGKPSEPVQVDPSLVSCLKPHQAEGIQFLFDCTIESLSRLNDGGGGGILAHCMGLGKTLQVVSFLHTVMTHKKTSQLIKHVLIIVPKNVVLNWHNEFEKWLDNRDVHPTINVLELDSLKNNYDRHTALSCWHNSQEPCVMLIGYDMFRILTQEKGKSKKAKVETIKKKVPKKKKKLMDLMPDFQKFLQDPGPDLIVCDEAHKLKNADSALGRAVSKIFTKRRICLTGTPLQNNLLEYHCMVNFVKPGLLGTKTEFSNRFATIINRGRTCDASPLEVRLMKRRCHVLYEKLKKVVDRKDYRVLTVALPPKQEYVINVRLTSKQIALYKAFLELTTSNGKNRSLLPDYYVFSRIWTHPYQLIAHEINLERKQLLLEEKEDDENFINDSESESSACCSYKSEGDSDVIVLNSDDEVMPKASTSKKSADTTLRYSKRLTGELVDNIDEDIPSEYVGWYMKTNLVSETDKNDFALGNKLILLIEIIKKCEEIGDKVLVFSQSIESLSLIKRMLQYMDNNDLWFINGHEAIKEENEDWGWLEGLDYMVIDGQVQTVRRQEIQTKFNDQNNSRARVLLISTRAGSLGTNMVGANRVVIFDACWNPSHDTQSLFRVYRFGQRKPVYVYRLIAQGTMEESIYKRQVIKESTSLRVIDEAQIQRHFGETDLEEMYKFEPDEIGSDDKDSSKKPSIAPPRDRLLADIILSHKKSIVNYILHDSLFEHLEEEKLTEEECQEAWHDYEREKEFMNSSAVQFMPHNNYQEMEIPGVVPLANNQKFLLGLQSDPLFSKCFQVRDANREIGIKVVLVKNSLSALLPVMPLSIRGGITEFTSFFMRITNDVAQLGGDGNQLLNRCLETFRSVVDTVQPITSCKPMLKFLLQQYPFLFNMRQMQVLNM